jgi:predicted dehydrogenase
LTESPSPFAHEPVPRVRIGVIGAGGFASFIADALAALDDVRLLAVADLAADRALAFARRHNVALFGSVDAMQADPSIDAVIIATPPNTHAQLTIAAVRAGKHVFCEKPAALSVVEAEQVADAVIDSGRSYVVDHVLRYNPLLAGLVRLVERGVLPEVRRFTFDNDAADENLDVNHWFWDSAISGGIFLEHGVHFFDAATILIGTGPVAVTGMASGRTNGTVDTVVAVASHPDGVLATHSHSFTHANRCERQHMRLDHGLAETRIEGWIPLRADIELWTDADGLRALELSFADLPELLDVPGFRLSGAEAASFVVAPVVPGAAVGRGQSLNMPLFVKATIEIGKPDAKQEIYAESVRAAASDLVSAIVTGRKPRSGLNAGLNAVYVAEAATRSVESAHVESVVDVERRST